MSLTAPFSASAASSHLPQTQGPLVILCVGKNARTKAMTLANGGGRNGRGAVAVYAEALTEPVLMKYAHGDLAMVVLDLPVSAALEAARLVRNLGHLRTQVIVQVSPEERDRLAEVEEAHEVSIAWEGGHDSQVQGTMRSAIPVLLRAFEQLSRIESSRQQLLRVLRGIGSVLRQNDLPQCAVESIRAMAHLFGKTDGFLFLWKDGLKAGRRNVIGIGRYEHSHSWEGSTQLETVFDAIHQGKAVVSQAGIAIPICLEDGSVSAVVFLDGVIHIGGDASWIADVLASNIARSLSRVGEGDRVAYLELHDESTRLPNRRAIELAIDGRIKANRTGGSACVIEVRSYAEIEAAFGEVVASRMMRVLAERLGHDGVGRIAPNQLAMLDCGCSGNCPVRQGVFLDPVIIGDQSLPIQAEMGVCQLDGVTSGRQAIQNARAAIRRNVPQPSRSDRVRQYREEDINSLASRLTMISDLKQALTTTEQLEVHYQPQYNIRTGMFIGVEALIRWNRLGAPVSPAVFIPIAETCGLIHQLGLFSIKTAVEQAASWYRNGLPTVVGINLSPAQLSDAHVADHIMRWVDESGVPAHLIEFELTETSATSHETAEIVVSNLRDRGFRIAIDDFGTGYSSLQRLANLQFDRIKVDREFVIRALESKNHRAVCEFAANLGHSLGISVVAEGVETLEQATLMLEIGCKEVQGFYYGRPVPADQITGANVAPNPAGVIEWLPKHC